MSFSFRVANLLRYQWRRNNWLFYLPRLFSRYEKIEIRDPVFFLGNQGAGLTLVSRAVRRNSQAISITGDHTYWAGADEMQRVMMWRLPPDLRLGGRVLSRDFPHKRFAPPRSWSYASDELLNAYRKTEADYDPESAGKLRFLIREALFRYGSGMRNERFVDKSQVFTLKIGYIEALLKGTNPYFVLVTRNPYAACYRAAMGKAGDMERYTSFMDLDERMEVCVQHWSNAMECALEDRSRVTNFHTVRFEDFLREPKKSLVELCDFLELPFQESMVPSEHHELPLGSRYRDRWYPLRPEVNKQYIEGISDRHLAMVKERCGAIAEELGYKPPRRLSG